MGFTTNETISEEEKEIPKLINQQEADKEGQIKEMIEDLSIKPVLKRYLQRAYQLILNNQSLSLIEQRNIFLFDIKKQLQKVHYKYDYFEFMQFIQAIDYLHLLAVDNDFSKLQK